MRRVFAVFFVLCALLFAFPVTANAASPTPVEDFEYTRQDPGTVLLKKYTGSSRTVTVPGSYLVDGITHRVELASQTVFAGNASLTSVTISSGVTFENASMKMLFGNCTKLHTVKLNADTSAVTDMSYLFYGCEALETLELSALNTANVTTMRGMFSNCSKLKKLTGYENWNTGELRSIAYMFDQTVKLSSVDLSRWSLGQLENSAWCFQKCGASKILLPEDLAVISAGFLNHAASFAGSSFTVPAGVKKIGYAHTIYDFATDDFTEFRVAEGNAFYKALDGILYSTDGTQMLAIPRGKTFLDNTYEIPDGVTFLGELSFSRNYNIETVVLPDSYILKYIPLHDPSYITFEDSGNLNSGLNLNIAIYCYTGVKAYAVKDSNPNYKGIDGVLYTKDGTTLVAVPTRYEGLLEIPEGITTWQASAMWDAGELVDSLMKNCTGVYIPSSMTRIADDQLEKLNRLEKGNSNFSIIVNEKNPVYYTGKSGQLLERSNLENLEISVLQDTFVYDGQPKTPEPTVTYNGKSLKAGKDYTLSYLGNTDAGTAWVRITGQGDYYGTVERSFTIEKAQPDYALPGSLTAVYGQTLGQIALSEGFTWVHPDTPVGDAGSHAHTVSYTNGNPNYVTISDIPVTVLVQPRQVGTESLCIAWWYPWTGSKIEPTVSVADSTGVVPAEEYTLSYENNSSFGKARAVLRDVPGGNYDVSGTAEFYIVPGPFLCTAVLTLLWCMTTGLTITKGKKAGPSAKQPKNP